MPQMAPISWLSLFFIFFMTFIMFNMMNYYSFTPTKPKSNLILMKKNFFFNWKW